MVADVVRNRSRRPLLGAWAGWADAIRTSLWPVPTVGITVAISLAIVLTHVDHAVGKRLPSSFTYWVFGGDAEAARAILGSLASSLITVTSLTFSLTVVTLQLASSQFSPRLLRTFTRDRVVQGTLALFLGTFVFALTVLRSVRSSTEAISEAFVPRISVTVAYLLTIASVIGLVLFLAHLAGEIRVETMLRTVRREGEETVRRTLTGLETTGHNDSRPVEGAVPLLAPASGFLLYVHSQQMNGSARETDATIMVTAAIGVSVVEGTPIGYVWPTDDERVLAWQERRELQDRFAAAVGVGFERTSVDDVGFGLRQLTDIASKALSPGINDPTTATHALGHSSALLCTLARLPLGDELVRDDRSDVRVIVRRPSFPDLLALAVDQPRRYGAGEPQVAERLFHLLREVAWVAPEPSHRQAVRIELRRLWSAVDATRSDDVQHRRYDRLRALVESTLAEADRCCHD